MGVYKWLCRKGTPGQTARAIARLFLAIRATKPEASPGDIYWDIMCVRQLARPYSEKQLAHFSFLIESPSVDLASFILQTVLEEAGVDTLGMPWKKAMALQEAIHEELQSVGVPPDIGRTQSAQKGKEGTEKA